MKKHNKLWSWTEKQHRKHHPFTFWVKKPQGCRHEWAKAQRAYNKRQLHIMMDGVIEDHDWYINWDVPFINNNRHSGLWDLW